VYLVGAGPGDPGLLTVRARELIASADAIVYGRGTPRALLSVRDAHQGPRTVYHVGRRRGRAALTRTAVRQLIVGLARQGKRVVRLLPGDALMFGPGSEEAQALHDAGIEFEIVPGVPVAVAAAAFAGIPVTSGLLATSATLVRGRAAARRADWTAIARSGATVVAHDALGALPRIIAGYAAAGVPGDIPAAAIARVGQPTQRTVTATLATLGDAVARAGLRHDVTVVIGWTVLLRDELAWVDQRPLFGRRILVADAADGSAALISRLRELGAAVRMVPAPDVARLDLDPLRAAIARLSTFEWLVFASAGAVNIFWEQLLVAGLDTRALSALTIAAVGPSTAAALLDRGITVDIVQDRFTASALFDALVTRDDVGDSALLYVADEMDPEALGTRLAEAGADVTVVPVLRHVPAERRGAGIRHALTAGRVALVVLATPSAAREFVRWAGAELAASTGVAAADAVTAERARALGLDVRLEGTGGTGAELAEAIAGRVTAA